MSDPIWFVAFEGQPHGPYPESQLRELIAGHQVTAETLIWRDGMAMLNWLSGRKSPARPEQPAGARGLDAGSH
jgi:GYF domain 2